MPDAAITGNSVHEDFSFNHRSRSMSDSQNMQGVDPRLDVNSVRKPDYFVYVFSVVDPRPPGYHLIRECSPLIHRLQIAELAPGDRYVLVTKIPQPTNQRWLDPASNQWRVDEHSAERLAQNIVHADAAVLGPNGKVSVKSMDVELRPEQALTEGNDYGKLGVFWSLNEVPADEEIEAAIKRKERFYRRRLDQARAIEASNPKSLYDHRTDQGVLVSGYLTPTDHVAADYFGEEFVWHKVSRKPENCPNCGDSIKAGVAFHASAALGGVICVIDWKRAVEAGVKKLKDVPVSKRWDNKEAFTGEMGE